MKIVIRFATLDDLEEIQQLFIETISEVCKNDYSPQEIEIWVSSVKSKKRWIEKLTNQYFLIAELNDKIVGYCSLENDNYIDLLYVHKDYQQKGIANLLYSKIEMQALKKNVTHLTVDASITAKVFFEKKDYHVLKKQINVIQKVQIINYKMIKEIQK